MQHRDTQILKLQALIFNQRLVYWGVFLISRGGAGTSRDPF